jgi:serine/threonine protein kinase
MGSAASTPAGTDLDAVLRDYAFEGVLGMGTYGVVVKVTSKAGDGTFAVKCLNTDEVDTAASGGGSSVLAPRSELARREQNIYQSIWEGGGHPLIVRLFNSLNWPDGQDFSKLSLPGISKFHLALVMEFCPMGDLERFMSQHMRNGWSDGTSAGTDRWCSLLRLFTAELCQVLDFLHNAKRVIYRDLKPENVLMAGSHERPHIKLADFGFAKELNPDDPPASLAGTPYFISPEMRSHVLEEGQRVTMTPKIDVYALGRLVFVMAWGCDLYQKGETNKDKRLDPKQWIDGSSEESLAWKPPCSFFPTDVVPNPKRFTHLKSLKRVPNEALELILKAKSVQPSDRADIVQMKALPLFGPFKLPDSGTELPPIDWDTLGCED